MEFGIQNRYLRKLNQSSTLHAQTFYERKVQSSSSVWVDACKSMVEFTHDVGIPENLVTDGTGEFTRKDVKFVKRSEMNANENTTTVRSGKESESCSRVRCRIPHYVQEVKDDKEEGAEVHSRFQG